MIELSVPEKWILRMFYEGKAFDAIPKAAVPIMAMLHEKNILKMSSGNDNSFNIAITRLGLVIAESIAPVSRKFITTTNNGSNTQSTHKLINTIKELAGALINSTVEFDLTPQSLDTMNQILYPDNEQETKAQVIDLDASLRNTMMLIARVNTLLVPLDKAFIPEALSLVEMGLLSQSTKNGFTSFEFTHTGLKTLNRILFDELDFWSDTAKIYPAMLESDRKEKKQEKECTEDEQTFIQCNVSVQSEENVTKLNSENIKTEQQTEIFNTIAASLGLENIHQLKDAIDFHIANSFGIPQKEKDAEDPKGEKGSTNKPNPGKNKKPKADNAFASFLKAVKNTKGKGKNANGQNQE